MSRLFRALFIATVATAAVVGTALLVSGRKLRLPEGSESRVPGEVDTDEIGPEQAAALIKELGTHL